MNPLIAKIEAQLHEIFKAYAEGMDVAPAKRFRTEGLMEAACLLELCDEQALHVLLHACWQGHFNSDFPGVAKEVNTAAGKQTDIKSFGIPSMMKRAPVYPSTK